VAKLSQAGLGMEPPETEAFFDVLNFEANCKEILK